MNAKLGAVIAENEIERGIERARSKRAEMADNGAYRGGTRPFGYESDGVTVRESEADELRAAAKRVLAERSGQSLSTIAADWNERGVTTTRGKTWTGPAVRRVLVRARNAALIEHHGAIVGPAQWKRILEEDTFAGLRSVLGDGAPTYRQAPRAERLLSGVARCGVDGCGAYLIGSGSSQAGTHRYRCSASQHLKRQADALDAYVAGCVVDLLSRPDAVELVSPRGDDATELHTRAAAARARRDALAEDFAAGDIERSQLKAGTARINADLAELESQLADLAAGTVLDGIAGHADAAAIWEALPIERRRAIVDATVTVTVLPGRRGGTGAFDPAHVRVERKAPER